MSAWEYAEFEVSFSGLNRPVGWECFFYSTDGQHQNSKGKESYGAQLAKLGEEGWEVVACQTRALAGVVLGSLVVTYVLRRPK